MFIIDLDYQWMLPQEEIYPYRLQMGEASITVHLPKERNTIDDVPLELLRETIDDLFTE